MRLGVYTHTHPYMLSEAKHKKACSARNYTSKQNSRNSIGQGEIRYKKVASIGSKLPSEAKHKKACAVHQNTDIDRDRGRQDEQTENTLMRIQNSEHPQNVGTGKEQSEACKNSTEHSTVRTGNIGRKLFSGKNHKKSCSVRKHTGIHHQ